MNMRFFSNEVLKKLYKARRNSHKGENGKLLVIGGSELFHAASMWALEVASKIVDMVFYSSVSVNEEIVKKQKERFNDGIVVPEGKLEEYIEEADCALIGPGMERGSLTRRQVNELVKKYKSKKWVIDGGALQEMDVGVIPRGAILTPHKKEFEGLLKKAGGDMSVGEFAKKYKCVVLLKGVKDEVCNEKGCVMVEGGNAGMTKGGTGDVLAGVVAALNCKNDSFLAAQAGSYINKVAGDSLHKRVGIYFNASDLVSEVPRVMKKLLFF